MQSTQFWQLHSGTKEIYLSVGDIDLELSIIRWRPGDLDLDLSSAPGRPGDFARFCLSGTWSLGCWPLRMPGSYSSWPSVNKQLTDWAINHLPLTSFPAIEVTEHERNGISNHWRLTCWFNSLSSLTTKKLLYWDLLYWFLCKGNPLVTSGFPSQRASNA